MTAVIEVKELSKIFKLKQQAPGIINGIKALLCPRFKDVTAVANLTFSVESGERIAFIGPNGAGKSTTIKMLTGILYPTKGSIKVLGFDPSTQRKSLALHIGTVFGQRPQLWYHLPAADTLRFLGHIYGIESAELKSRLAELSDLLDLEELLKVPVRKLSLGQRMRCEIAASLLHRPRILFLDEPTIGLDVIAKQQIRSFIKRLNETHGTTVFLTSHDPADIESLAQRAVVINDGQLVFDGDTEQFLQSFIKKKTIEIVFKVETALHTLPVGKVLLWEPFRAKVELDTATERIDQLLNFITSTFAVQDINIYDPEMEEIIRNIYARAKEVP